MARRSAQTTETDDARDEKLVETGLNANRRQYYSSVRGVAHDLVRRVLDGEITDPDELNEAIHESVDGNHWVIYTHASMLCLLASDNDGQYFEEGLGADGVCTDDGINWAALAFAAMRQDVVEDLERIDSDLFSASEYDKAMLRSLKKELSDRERE